LKLLLGFLMLFIDMPYEIKLNDLPAGYAVKGAPKGGQVTVRFRDFFSSEDGQELIHHLEGVPRDIILKLPPEAKASESRTDNLLAIIRKDQTATVYYNDFFPTSIIRIKSKVQAGERIYSDHIMDLERVELTDFNIPEDASICYVFSFGWRKGLFFDYGPTHVGKERPRGYDLGRTFAQFHAQVLFQHLFSIGDDIWKELFRQGWFPFIYLKHEQIKNFIALAKQKLLMDDAIPNIRDNLLTTLAERLPDWEKDIIIAPHFEFVNAAYKHYVANDYLSAAAILFPRIEGIMRTHAQAVVPGTSLKQENLATVSAVGGGKIAKPASLLLPDRFKQYLTEIYFADFDPKNPQGVSRNTVSHGVVDAKLLDCKAATIAFLILLQISSVSSFAMKPPP
jgi:hypothetical protein